VVFRRFVVRRFFLAILLSREEEKNVQTATKKSSRAFPLLLSECAAVFDLSPAPILGGVTPVA
jgi:hypothetical protein